MYGIIFILFILNIVSFYTPFSMQIEIPFIIMIIYYWTIYRPTLLPPVLVFVIGCTHDLLSGLPLGLSALIFLLVRHAIAGQRIFLTSQPFMVFWLGYILVSITALLCQWLIFGLLQFHWTPLAPALIMIAIGILVFPLISLLMNGAHKLLPDY